MKVEYNNFTMIAEEMYKKIKEPQNIYEVNIYKINKYLKKDARV